MKLPFAIAILAASLSFSGCSTLFPKKVEFGQDKVEKFPEERASHKELERQAVQRAAEKAREAEKIAERDGSDAAIPAGEAGEAAEAAERSLGPPKRPYDGETSELRKELDRAIAKLDARIRAFEADNNVNAGKKIEGTGFFQIPYFLWIGLLLVIGFIAWTILKAVASVAAAGSPPVALGLTAVRTGGKLASLAVGQLVAGGEKFKGWLKTEIPELSEEARKKIEDLFNSAHKESQDAQVRAVIDELKR